MRITDLRTAVVEGNFDWTYVRLYTNTDEYGTGESFMAPGLTAILAEFKDVLIGEDPRNVDRLWNKMRWAASGAGSVAGIIYNAITGIETALLDLVGKHYRVPVWQLLGGRYREKVRIYVDCHGGEALESLSPLLVARPASWVPLEKQNYVKRGYFDPADEDDGTPENYALRARKMVANGFTALKFDLDLPQLHKKDPYNRAISNAEIDYMINLVKATREAVGDEIDLAFDCHWRYNVTDVIKIAQGVEPYRLLWLEDPTPPENPGAMRLVRQSTRTPIATGENLYLRHGFRELLEQQAISLAAPDLQKVGGLMEARRIADMAETYYVALAPHNISSPLGTVAAAHLSAAIPNFACLEFHAHDVPFWADLVTGRDSPVVQDGTISLSDKPGLGVELNEEVARRYSKAGELFFGEPVQR